MRAVIAEDAVLLREGLARLLDEGGFDVVDCVADGEALLRSVEQHQPDVCVVDIRMPPTFSDEGVRAALVIRKQWPDVSLLMLSQYVEERYAVDLLAGDSSGIGYLLKDRVADVAEFLEALRRVAAGGAALDPEVVTQLLVRSRPQGPARAALAARARSARADGRGPHQQPRSPSRSSSPRAPSRSTSRTSSSSSACRPPTRRTAACWPSCATWSTSTTMTARRQRGAALLIGGVARAAVRRDRRRAGRGLDDRRRRAHDAPGDPRARSTSSSSTPAGATITVVPTLGDAVRIDSHRQGLDPHAAPARGQGRHRRSGSTATARRSASARAAPRIVHPRAARHDGRRPLRLRRPDGERAHRAASPRDRLRRRQRDRADRRRRPAHRLRRRQRARPERRRRRCAPRRATSTPRTSAPHASRPSPPPATSSSTSGSPRATSTRRPPRATSTSRSRAADLPRRGRHRQRRPRHRRRDRPDLARASCAPARLGRRHRRLRELIGRAGCRTGTCCPSCSPRSPSAATPTSRRRRRRRSSGARRSRSRSRSTARSSGACATRAEDVRRDRARRGHKAAISVRAGAPLTVKVAAARSRLAHARLRPRRTLAGALRPVRAGHAALQRRRRRRRGDGLGRRLHRRARGLRDAAPAPRRPGAVAQAARGLRAALQRRRLGRTPVRSARRRRAG